MITTIIATLVVAVWCAVCYMIGGLSKEDGKKAFPWLPAWIFHGKVRDVGCTLGAFAWMYCLYPQVNGWIHLIAAVLMYFALTTYHDWTGKDNFYFHGLGVALAYLPYAYVTGMWLGFAIRVIAVSIIMGLWSKYNTDAKREEAGRGATIGVTLPFMLIP